MAVKKTGIAGFTTVLRAIDDPNGTPETGVNELTGGIEFYYHRGAGASVVSFAPVSLASVGAAWSSAGLIEFNTGLYRLDLPSSAASTGASMVWIWGKATSIIFQMVEYALEDKTLSDVPVASATASAVASMLEDDSGASTISSEVWAAATRTLTANTNLNDPTASSVATEVWATTSRVLTANTNLNDPTAAAVASAVASMLEDDSGASTISSEVWATATRALTDKTNFSATYASTVESVGSVTDSVAIATLDSGVATSIASAVASMLSDDSGASTISTEVWATATRVLTANTNLDGVSVNLTQIDGTASAASNASDFFTTTGYDASPSAIGSLSTMTLSVPTASVAPSATPAFDVALSHLYTAWRNKTDITSSLTTFYADDGSTKIYTRTVSSSGSTVTLGEIA